MCGRSFQQVIFPRQIQIQILEIQALELRLSKATEAGVAKHISMLHFKKVAR